jgi:hypothetical protein
MMVLSRHSDKLGERFVYAICTMLLAASGFASRHSRRVQQS